MATVVPNHLAANRRRALANCTLVRDVVHKAGMRGVRIMEIARRTRLSKTTVMRWIHALEIDAKIERSGVPGRYVRYGPPGIYAHYRELLADVVAYCDAAKDERREAQIERWANHVPLHRTIRAAEAKPLCKRGPASVWELA